MNSRRNYQAFNFDSCGIKVNVKLFDSIGFSLKLFGLS